MINKTNFNDMRTKLLMILFLCLPLGMMASNAGDNGYDDIDGFFSYCSKVKSPGLRYTYISSQMIKRVSALPMGNFDLKSIDDKIDFVQSVYAVTEFDSSKECALKAESLPQAAIENGFERVISFNKDGAHTNVLMKSGEGGFNSMLMVNVFYNDQGSLELVVVAFIGGVFSDDEILTLIKF